MSVSYTKHPTTTAKCEDLTLLLLDGASNDLLIFAHAGKSAPTGPVTLTRANNGEAVALSAGASLKVVLPGNPTTGYQWELAATDKSLLPLVDSGYTADSTTRVGSGGTYQFRFEARGAGDVPLRLVYKRSWETEIAETFSVTVNIR